MLAAVKISCIFFSDLTYKHIYTSIAIAAAIQAAQGDTQKDTERLQREYSGVLFNALLTYIDFSVLHLMSIND